MHILKDNLSSCVLARDILKALSLRQRTDVNKLTLHKTNFFYKKKKKHKTDVTGNSAT